MASRNKDKRGPVPRDVQVSKKLSWLLRHGAEKEGLTLDSNGYINLTDVLANRNIKSLKITFDEIREAVEKNEKQRFSMILDPSKTSTDSATDSASSTKPGDWLIRANQGHSIKVDADGDLLKPITKDNLPSAAVHGTTHANWVLIVESGGLKPMGRNHVHFASGLPSGFKTIIDQFDDAGSAAAPVISGMRSSATILIFVDLVKAIRAGLSFGLSQNGVILTAGNELGLVPLEVLSRVEDRTGEGVLLENGAIIKQAPASWAKKAKSAS